MDMKIETAKQLLSLTRGSEEVEYFEKNATYASKVYTSEEDFFNSPELAEIYDVYSPKELFRFKSVAKKSEFIRAYVEEVDPTTNYGRNFKLYRVYKADGIKFLNEVTAGSMISSQPFQSVIDYDDGFLKLDIFIEKGEEQRQYLRDNSDYITVM